MKRFLKRLLKGILILLVLMGAVYYVFVNFVDNETKNNVYDSLGIGTHDSVRELTLDSYIDVSQISSHKNLLGKWVIRGWLINTHRDRVIDQIGIRIDFSDGSETIYIAKSLNPGGLGKPFTIKISGHSNAYLIDWQVVNAR